MKSGQCTDGDQPVNSGSICRDGRHDWRDDLSYPLIWEPRWSGWRIPTPLWFWELTP